MSDSATGSGSLLERIAAELDIREVLTRYCRGVDRCDEDLLLSVFHDDASVRLGSRELCALRFAHVMTASTPASLESCHHLTNVHVELVARDRAIAESYFLNLRTADDSREQVRRLTIVSGRYLDALQAVDQGWLITERLIVMDAAADGIAGSDYPALQTNLRGSPGLADPFVEFRARHAVESPHSLEEQRP